MDFTAGIKDDLNYVDGSSTWRCHHIGAGNHDVANGTWAATEEKYSDIPNCLRRALADRQLSSTRQVQQRMESIQKDDINVQDMVLEIPHGFPVAIDDQIQEVVSGNDMTGPRYMIVSIDDLVFRSRKRLGCRILK